MERYCPQCNQKYGSQRLRFCPQDGTRLLLPDPYELVGSTLDHKYRIDEFIAAGGMGVVYSAHHLIFDLRIAFKMLLPHLALQQPELVDLFVREARLAFNLTHENIVRLYDAGRVGTGKPGKEISYIALEWLDGRALDEELAAGGPFSLERAANVLRQVAAALDYAHAQRVVHRDLKPSNVMVMRQPEGSERVKVLDFGIAKILDATAQSPISRVAGTLRYGSPEQYQPGASIDGRADIYALGVLLFELLTGELPFNSENEQQLMQLHLTAPPPSLRYLRPDAPPGLEELINRMLAKKPEQRPANMREVLRLFELALPPTALAAPPLVPVHNSAPTVMDLQAALPLLPTDATSQVDVTALPRPEPAPQPPLPAKPRPLRRWPFLLVGLIIGVPLLALLVYWEVRELLPALQPQPTAVSVSPTPKPDDASTYTGRGKSYYKEGDYDRAIAEYNKAIELDPNYVEAYFRRGDAYDEKKDYDRALADYDKAIELKPTATIYFYRGLTHYHKGDNDRAIADYSKAIELSPSYAAPYYNRGLRYHNKGQVDRALADYNKAIELTPGYADAYHDRGRAYDDKRDYERALADYNKAIELKPNDARAYNNRGTTYYNQGNYDRAIVDYDKALALRPNYELARKNREDALRKKKESKR